MKQKSQIMSMVLAVIMVFTSTSMKLSVTAEEYDVTEKQYVILTHDAEETQSIIEEDVVDDILVCDGTTDVIVATLCKEQTEELDSNPNVVAIEENIFFAADSVDHDTETARQSFWNKQMIDADELEVSGDAVRIGVMDSGVNGSSDLEVEYYQDYIEEGSFLFPDISGHGTAVASVIASEYCGINPNVELYSIKVLDENNQGSLSNVISGIYWAIENEIKILNMSFGTTTYSEALKIAIEEAIDNDILIIASAGNDGTTRYPAVLDGVISVGSVNYSGDAVVNDYENAPMIYAPGEQILSVGDFDTLVSKSGASMAAPQVTAVSAAVWSMDLNRSADFVKQLILATANVSTGKAVVDAEMAIENYSAFAAVYQENEQDNYNILNNDELTTFDDATFEALWKLTEHNAATTQGLDGLTFTTAQMNMLKKFSCIPDNTDVTFNSLASAEGVTAVSVVFKNYLTGKKFQYSDGTWFELGDEGELDFRQNRLLHGGQNYVASLKYLLAIAENLWYGNYYKNTSYQYRDIIYHALVDEEAEMATANSFYNDMATYGNIQVNSTYVDVEEDTDNWFKINTVTHKKECTANEQKKILQQLIYLAADCSSNTLKLSFADESKKFQKEAAIKVLGVALHLIGDIYAHRTIIPSAGMDGAVNFSTGSQASGTDVAYTIYKGSRDGVDFYGHGLWGGYHGIKKMILGSGSSQGGAKITTRQINGIWQEEQVAKEGKREGEYEDNHNFLPGRYSFTKITTKMYLELFLSNAEFTPDVFKISLKDNNNKYIKIQRLGDLRRFVKYTEGSISSTYLQYYDSKVTMSDVVTGVSLQGPTSNTDSNWYTRGTQLSY